MNEKVFFQKKMRIIFFFPFCYHYVYEEEGKKMLIYINYLRFHNLYKMALLSLSLAA